MTQEVPRWSDHHPDHDHQMLLYESHDQQFASVAPFVREGLAAGERCTYLVHDNTEAEVVDALRQRGVDVDAARETDQLTVRPATEVYLDDGTFDPDRMVEWLQRRARDAVDAGYPGVRMTGETTWASDHDVDPDRLLEYERRLDAVVPDESVVGLCQYRRSAFDPDLLGDLLRIHPKVTHDAEPRPNCYYCPPEHRGDDGCSSAAIDRSLETISVQHRLADTLADRERCLSLLGQYTEQLRDADPDEIERIAGDIVAEIVEPTVLLFWEYDAETGTLREQVLRNALEGRSPEAVVEPLAGRAWTAFVEDEPREATVDGAPSASGVLLPVGRHGVFFVATPESRALSETDVAFLRSVCGHTEAALDQAAYERELERERAELGDRNAELERVDQINTVVREISRSLVDAAEEDELTRTVCERLADETDASFVWYGTYDAATESLRPSQAAGDGKGYLTSISVDDDSALQEPAGQAARSREIEVRESIYDSQPLAHWQEQALKRDFRSVVSLPISYDESPYGVLTLYADTPGAFSGETAAVLDELGDLVALAINSIRRKEALVTESVTELKLRVGDTDVHVVPFVDRTGARVEFEEVVAASDGGFRVFVTIRGATPEAIREFGKTAPTIESLEILSDADDAHTCECIVTDQCFVTRLLRHNAVPRSVHVEDGEANLVIRLPRETGVREFMEMFTAKYPDADLVGQRDREDSLRQLSDIESRAEAELTDRQIEIVKLAYHSGYFDRPRKRTVEEIAESLDVSHPTVSRHLREAEQKVFSLLFDG